MVRGSICGRLRNWNDNRAVVFLESIAMKKICAICGKEFKARYPWQKCCSHECSKAQKLVRARKWRAKHPEYHREYAREHHVELKARRIKKELAK